MSEFLQLPKPTREISKKRKELTPNQTEAFRNFSRAVFADGALDMKTKQLIAVAVAHTTQCQYCITGHVDGAKNAGATDAEIMEAIWVAAEMRAGASWAHAFKSIDVMAAMDGE